MRPLCNAAPDRERLSAFPYYIAVLTPYYYYWPRYVCLYTTSLQGIQTTLLAITAGLAKLHLILLALHNEVRMKRRAEREIPTSARQKKRIEELGLNLSSTSDDDTQHSNHGTQESSTSGTGSDSEIDEKRPVFGLGGKASTADPPAEGTSSNYSMFNSVSQRLMAKMGFREGEGLGKYGQGRKEIIETSNQKGRRGLGLILKGFEKELNVSWRDMPEATAYEEVDWFPECTTEIPDADELSDWMTVGKRKMIIDDETEFCREPLLRSLLECKSAFDELEGEEMRRARTRSNPYEMIRGVFFLNRAAMKMANIDHVFDYMFTNPKDSKGKPQLKDRESELLYFADVCAGPGGFSEYALWRKKWHAKGFGMTLKGPNDFKLEDFYSASSELFEPYYGEGGVDGDGDVTRPENITAFRNFVLDNTDHKGVHFMMADGGFSVEGQENIQEILCKQLLLCQFLVGLSVVRTGGHFICKTFDLFTPFSIGLIYLLYCCFERVCLFKPVTSRPANSERYVVCRGLKAGIEDVRNYLFTVNLRLNQLRNSDQDVNLVVPLEVLRGDRQFYEYMVRSNESCCEVQIKALAKIHAFVQDSTLSEPRQADIRKECLKLWGIPDQARVAPTNTDPKKKFFQLIQSRDLEVFNFKPTPLTAKTLEKLSHVLDYRCMVSGSEQRFLLGMGRSQIYTWGGRPSERWTKLELKTELPRDTLLSVEIVFELKGEGKAQRKIGAIHILDALFLNGMDVRPLHFNQRIQLAEKYVKAVSKPSRPDMNPIRVKEVYRLEEIQKIFLRLEMKIIKSSGGIPRLSYTGRDDRHFVPSGLYIVKTMNDPWTMAFSKSHNRKYFYNLKTKISTYEVPVESIAPFQVCYSERLFWEWNEGVQIHESQKRDPNPDKLSKDDVLHFIRMHQPSSAGGREES